MGAGVPSCSHLPTDSVQTHHPLSPLCSLGGFPNLNGNKTFRFSFPIFFFFLLSSSPLTPGPPKPRAGGNCHVDCRTLLCCIPSLGKGLSWNGHPSPPYTDMLWGLLQQGALFFFFLESPDRGHGSSFQHCFFILNIPFQWSLPPFPQSEPLGLWVPTNEPWHSCGTACLDLSRGHT